MKCSLSISNFLEEICSLFHSIVFRYFFALITEEGLSLHAILWSSAFKWVYLSFSPLLFTSLLFTAICKASPDSHTSKLSRAHPWKSEACLLSHDTEVLFSPNVQPYWMLWQNKTIHHSGVNVLQMINLGQFPYWYLDILMRRKE